MEEKGKQNFRNFCIWVNKTLAYEEKFSLFRSRKFLGMALLLTLLWQAYYYQNSDQIGDEVKRKYTTGFAYNLAQNFIYFYYYLGYFPIYTTSDPVYTEAGAKQVIEEKGETLFMECEHWSRLGEHARIFAFLPNAWVEGNTRIPSIKLFNALFFTMGLFSLLIAFYLVKRMLLGTMIVLFVGGSPFYLYETYANENIFGLGAAVAFILLGLVLPALFNKKRKLDWIIAPTIGTLIAFACNVRAELLPILLSPIFIYFTHKSYRLLSRVALVVLVVGGYLLMNGAVKGYFNQKFEQAGAVVKAAGGHPYEGAKIASHGFWHPVFCGLADYDKKYGYVEWRDSIAYSYAIPILREKYHLDLTFTEGWHLNEYYDKDRYYYKKFDEIPQYDEVLKNKVLTDIKNDPLWYLDILFKRVNKVLNNTSPIGFGNAYLEMRGVGWLILPVLLLLLLSKNWTYLKLLLFTIPLLATPLMIYSGGNATYNSPYHIILIALFLYFAIGYLIQSKTMNFNKQVR